MRRIEKDKEKEKVFGMKERERYIENLNDDKMELEYEKNYK